MINELEFQIQNGIIEDYKVKGNIGIKISCKTDKEYSFILYKNTVFLVDDKDNVIVNNGIKVYSDEYAYIRFYFESVPNNLVEEFIDLLELMIKREHIKYAFVVMEKSNPDIHDKVFFDRGYEEFFEIDSERLAQKLGAYIIFDAAFRKEVYSDKS